MHLLWLIPLAGVLFAVHTLGHYGVARLLGVQVLCLSLGRGPRLIGWQRGETTFRIGAIPIGGSVRLLGHRSTDAVTARDRARSIAHRPLWQRALVIVAGPAASLAFPVLLYVQLHAAEEFTLPAVVGTVFEHQPADGVLKAGDRIVEIDGEAVSYWEDVTRLIAAAPGRNVRVVVERPGEPEPVTATVKPRAHAVLDSFGGTNRIGRLGVSPRARLAQIGVARLSDAKPATTTATAAMGPLAAPAPGPDEGESPAARAGLRTFDIITSVQGRAVETWAELALVLDRNHGEAIVVTWLRPDPRDAASGFLPLARLQPGTAQLFPVLRLLPNRHYETGIHPGDLFVHDVLEGSPAEQAGIHPGDELVGLDGHALSHIETLVEQIEERPRDSLRLAVRAPSGKLREPTLVPALLSQANEGEAHWSLGAEPSRANRAAREVAITWRLGRALRLSVRHAAHVTGTLLSISARLVTLRLSPLALVRPMALDDITGAHGAPPLLALLALLSQILGLGTLLPLPGLDGGRLLFLAREAFRRPVKTPRAATNTGPRSQTEMKTP